MFDNIPTKMWDMFQKVNQGSVELRVRPSDSTLILCFTVEQIIIRGKRVTRTSN